MKDYEIIEEAIRLLDTHGWAQGKPITEDGRICVSRAIQVAATYDPGQYRRVCLRISPWFAITVWNDKVTNTYDEVRARLAEVASQLRSEETP